MNDRFKFRFWNKELNRFTNGGAVKYGGICFIDTDGEDNIIKLAENQEDYIICQCTGLKDKNGTLIYEGDILGGTFGNLYVHYCDSCKQFQLKANDYGCMACEGDIHWYEVVEAEEQNELEVIGNIYENKELLNEQL